MGVLIENCSPEYFYITDDSFLARPEAEIQDFCDMYEEFKLPFWFNTRPETVSPERLGRLREVGCDRVSIGLEHGNEDYRRKVLKRNPNNEELLNAFGVLADSEICFSVNNIIGFPDAREMVFETIEFNRQLRGYDTLTVSIFTPYHGTELREVAIDRGYLASDTLTTHTTSSSLLNMPKLTSDVIDGLARTFTMYVMFPKELWPEIRLAEDFSEPGEQKFKELSDLYHRVFFKGDQFTEPDWEEVFGYMSKTQMR